MEDVFRSYMSDRVDDQIKYFDSNAIKNQKYYKWLKWISVSCGVSTTMTIALSFTVPDAYNTAVGILALILSSVVLGTYQIEEFQNYGAKWEKFRLVAEQLKSEKFMFFNRVGRYAIENDGQSDVNIQKRFVLTVENIIKGTDIAYFSLMVDPGKRIEKRLQNYGENLIRNQESNKSPEESA